MSNTSLYREVLLDHYRNPRNRGALDQADVVRRGSNPRCGDDIEVGITWQGDTLHPVRFHGRGCSVCIAAASMMTEAVDGCTRDAARDLCAQVRAWTEGKSDEVPAPELAPLDAVRQHSARQKCILLSWQALSDALSEQNATAGGEASS